MLQSPRKGFTGELWSAAEPIFRNVITHPFLTGLTDGTLDRAAFRFYIVEDSHYLTEFARVLSVAASKAPKDPLDRRVRPRRHRIARIGEAAPRELFS